MGPNKCSKCFQEFDYEPFACNTCKKLYCLWCNPETSCCEFTLFCLCGTPISSETSGECAIKGCSQIVCDEKCRSICQKHGKTCEFCDSRHPKALILTCSRCGEEKCLNSSCQNFMVITEDRFCKKCRIPCNIHGKCYRVVGIFCDYPNCENLACRSLWFKNTMVCHDHHEICRYCMKRYGLFAKNHYIKNLPCCKTCFDYLNFIFFALKSLGIPRDVRKYIVNKFWK